MADKCLEELAVNENVKDDETTMKCWQQVADKQPDEMAKGILDNKPTEMKLAGVVNERDRVTDKQPEGPAKELVDKHPKVLQLAEASNDNLQSWQTE